MNRLSFLFILLLSTHSTANCINYFFSRGPIYPPQREYSELTQEELLQIENDFLQQNAQGSRANYFLEYDADTGSSYQDSRNWNSIDTPSEAEPSSLFFDTSNTTDPY